ncbi:putative phage tail assembly chaperone [Vibrio jasicida]|uniref:putative phage tail assembly chaperone n=1 Tax=Vibrio jasicida TaxID=766224 RepID=UPI0005EDF7D5|nr:putative phage tail assembly chaperone [Vibrio jasicida]
MKNEVAMKSEQAMAYIKTLQGVKSATVPLIVNGQMVHAGMGFNVSLTDYNNYINAMQGNKATLTAVTKDFLMHTVVSDDKALLIEVLKVPGLMDYIVGELLPQVAPDVKATLD